MRRGAAEHGHGSGRGLRTPEPKKAWADLTSDDESDPDFSGLGCVSPLASPVAAKAAHSNRTETGSLVPVAQGLPTNLVAGGAPSGAAGKGPGEASVAQWAADLQSLAEQLRALAVCPPPELKTLSLPKRSIALEPLLSEACILRWEEANVALAACRAEVRMLSDEAKTAATEAEAAERRRARACKGVEEVTAWALAGAAGAVANQLAEHRRFRNVLGNAACGLDAAHAAVSVATRSACHRAGASECMFRELRVEAAAEVAAAEDASGALARAVVSRSRARDLPAILMKRAKAEARVTDVEAGCQQLRRSNEELRERLEAPSSAGARAEQLSIRAAQLERECRELQDGPANVGFVGRSAVAEMAAGELGRAQYSNRRLVVEVRDARLARDEVATAQEHLEMEVEEAKSRHELEQHKHAEWLAQEANMGESEAWQEALQWQCEVEELSTCARHAKGDVVTALASPSWCAEEEPGEAARLEELEACQHAEAAMRCELWRLEEMMDATERTYDHTTHKLIIEKPHSMMTRLMCSAKSTSAKARGPWARSTVH